MKKSELAPGKNAVMKLRDDEEMAIIHWLNMQDVYSDSIRYLIQKEIADNGLRNLQLFIPRVRSIDNLRSQFPMDVQATSSIRNSTQQEIVSESLPAQSVHVRSQEYAMVHDLNAFTGTKEPVISLSEDMLQKQNESGRKPAKKSFSAEVMKSYT